MFEDGVLSDRTYHVTGIFAEAACQDRGHACNEPVIKLSTG